MIFTCTEEYTALYIFTGGAEPTVLCWLCIDTFELVTSENLSLTRSAVIRRELIGVGITHYDTVTHRITSLLHFGTLFISNDDDGL